MTKDRLPIVGPGKRAIVSGRTGSGKSTLGCWLLNRSLQHWAILNPKWTQAYKNLPDSKVLTRFNESVFSDSLEKNRFTIINFDGKSSKADYMDDVISHIHGSFENVGLCADELYTLHTGGKPGPGLTGWLTRGRELKQSFMGMTQRPAWISRFCYSEADYIVGMDLSLKEDRKRLFDNTGNPHFLNRLEPRKWLWYDVNGDAIVLYGAVPLIEKA
jgi:hypothetical protein